MASTISPPPVRALTEVGLSPRSVVPVVRSRLASASANARAMPLSPRGVARVISDVTPSSTSCTGSAMSTCVIDPACVEGSSVRLGARSCVGNGSGTGAVRSLTGPRSSPPPERGAIPEPTFPPARRPGENSHGFCLLSPNSDVNVRVRLCLRPPLYRCGCFNTALLASNSDANVRVAVPREKLVEPA